VRRARGWWASDVQSTIIYRCRTNERPKKRKSRVECRGMRPEESERRNRKAERYERQECRDLVGRRSCRVEAVVKPEVGEKEGVSRAICCANHRSGKASKSNESSGFQGAPRLHQRHGLAVGGNNKAIRNDPAEEIEEETFIPHQHQHPTQSYTKTNEQNSPNTNERARGRDLTNSRTNHQPNKTAFTIRRS